MTSYINQGEWDAGNTGFDYAQMPDTAAEEARKGLVEEKGVLYPLFGTVLQRAKELRK